MTLIALVLMGIAMAGGMELQAFVDVVESSDGLKAVFILAIFIAVFGDLRRLG